MRQVILTPIASRRILRLRSAVPVKATCCAMGTVSVGSSGDADIQFPVKGSAGTGAVSTSTTTHTAKYGNTHRRVCLNPVPRRNIVILIVRLCP